jgi:hypothetical protein
LELSECCCASWDRHFDDLIDILESGVPIEAVLDMIHSRLETSRPAECS